MLDRFEEGHVARISPEAPIPILQVTRQTVHAGGAGNVARNLASLGVPVTLVGLVGQDQAGDALQAEIRLNARNQARLNCKKPACDNL